jgi:hypothetical protein
LDLCGFATDGRNEDRHLDHSGLVEEALSAIANDGEPLRRRDSQGGGSRRYVR